VNHTFLRADKRVDPQYLQACECAFGGRRCEREIKLRRSGECVRACVCGWLLQEQRARCPADRSSRLVTRHAIAATCSNAEERAGSSGGLLWPKATLVPSFRDFAPAVCWCGMVTSSWPVSVRLARNPRNSKSLRTNELPQQVGPSPRQSHTLPSTHPLSRTCTLMGIDGAM
jgi:hypothetical protein